MSGTNTGFDMAQRRSKLLKLSRGLLNLSLALLITGLILLVLDILEIRFTTFPPIILSLSAIVITFCSGRIRRKAEQMHV